MFKVMIPENWPIGEGRLILRLVDRKSRKSKSLSLTKGLYRNVSVGDLPNNAPGEVVAWVDLNAEGNSTPVTDRVNLGSLGKLKNIRTIIYGKTMVTSRKSELENIAEIANAWRWIQQDDDREAYAVSHNIINKIQSIDTSSENNLSFIFNFLNRKYSINDGSVISNQIAYIWSLSQINSAMKEGSESGSFHAAMAQGLPESSRKLDVARALLNQLNDFSELPAPRVVAASLESIIHGREAAATSYSKSLNDHRESIRRTGGLGGAISFGTLGSRRPIEIPELRIIDVGNQKDNPATFGRTTVLYSADPLFLKSYLTRLVYYIGLFPEYNYHFHFVGNEEECIRLALLTKRAFESNQSIRDKSTCTDHISFSWSNVPDRIPEPVSYYASARFLVGEQLIKLTDAPIWIQDVDLFPTGDTVPFLDDLSKHDVALFVSPFLHGTLPWVRYLAGNVYVNNTEQGLQFLHEASAYLTEWLLVENSWTVDQNALSFAVEICGPNLDIADVRDIGLPLQQSKLSARIES